MKNNFKSVGNPLHSILEKYKLQEPYIENFLIQNWSEIIDKSLINVIKPLSLSDHFLTLKVLDESWYKELEKQKLLLIKKLNSKLNNYSINDVKYLRTDR